ncbi:MAG: CPBP family intramembrane metalloprotease [Bernardetiaceae bacterium]|nr:CPBP family intramembrane metalloprotease [Bernardetiaceae bacterium]
MQSPLFTVPSTSGHPQGVQVPVPSTANELRPFWARFFRFDWKFGLWLILLVCVPRFALVLQANATANYRYLALIMVVSALLPFLFLTRSGWRQIGLRKPKNYAWLGLGLGAGLLASLALHWLGHSLYGNSFQNWYVYIGQSLPKPPGDGTQKLILFAVAATMSMIFSPVGEELFFRGIVNASFTESLGEARAAVADGAAFALTHLAHFGWVFVNGQWDFYWLPALLWVTGMFGVSLLFGYCKQRAGSLWGAVLGHAGFNLGMTYSIFYLL